MEWYEAHGIRLACLSGALSEERAEQLLMENTGELRVITADVNQERDFVADTKSPRFNRPALVSRIEKRVVRKPVEFLDDATGERHLEMVPCVEYWAYSEPYTASGATNGTGPLRRTEDICKSGPERFVKGDDGKIHQYGAATALLARLLEVAALQPVG